MRHSELMKRLKKQLRSTKVRMTLAIIVLLLSDCIGYLGVDSKASAHEQDVVTAIAFKRTQSVINAQATVAHGWTSDHLLATREPSLNSTSEETLRTVVQSGTSRKAYLKKNYICGVEMQLLGSMSVNGILQFSKLHPEYDLMFDSEGGILFTEIVADLSPKCKESAFFGIDKFGNLNLYDGTPGKDHVIRTFFQLNVEHMKSSLPQEAWEELSSGIRISDLAEFNSVLSTFSVYTDESGVQKQ